MKKIVLFASGNGSNAENIMAYFDTSNAVSVVGVFSNNSEAKVIERSKKFKVPTFVFNKMELSDDTVLNQLKQLQPDLIILAGFLLKFPMLRFSSLLYLVGYIAMVHRYFQYWSSQRLIP